MPFRYKAIDATGRISQGVLQAENENDLEARLQRMGLQAISIKPVRVGGIRWLQPNVTRQELITFCFYMEQLLRGGVPLLEGLQDLQGSMQQSRFREILSSLYEDVQSGKQLSQGMGRFPDVFDNVFTSLIHAGEESGSLDKVFHHLTESIKWQDELISHTKKILIYPAFVGVVVLGVMFFIMIYIVPELMSFITEMEEEPPLHTVILVHTSWFFQHFWYVILMTPIVVSMLIALAYRFSLTARYWLDRAKLRVWLIGPILRKIILARFSGFFAMMYASGITVMDGLKLCEQTVGNLEIQEAVSRVRERIADGGGISESFAKTGMFPMLVVRMVSIGESTGELDAALRNVSYFYDREVRESIGRIQAMIEPVMTLILGATLGWVMISVLGPIYDIMSKIQP